MIRIPADTDADTLSRTSWLSPILLNQPDGCSVSFELCLMTLCATNSQLYITTCTILTYTCATKHKFEYNLGYDLQNTSKTNLSRYKRSLRIYPTLLGNSHIPPFGKRKSSSKLTLKSGYVRHPVRVTTRKKISLTSWWLRLEPLVFGISVQIHSVFCPGIFRQILWGRCFSQPRDRGDRYELVVG